MRPVCAPPARAGLLSFVVVIGPSAFTGWGSFFVQEFFGFAFVAFMFSFVPFFFLGGFEFFCFPQLFFFSFRPFCGGIRAQRGS